ncbi:hypothetical protein [Streptomyces montanisoli]|uniref:hypothetical protein n=1 Tax=Streptomyces montanisoli TaxID=2798581 RepID=UPI001FD84795|nr:hypothetical protein [Streptomyces montanisoli]
MRGRRARLGGAARAQAQHAERGECRQGIDPEAITAWLRRTAESWPAIHPIIGVGRDAAAVDPELTDLVERWLGEAIGDIEDGLEAACRLHPHQRHFRGVLAMAQLDYVAQRWERADWKLTREQILEELAASWVQLLT